MGKQPAFLFYPNDWNRDMEEHPLEIQGAWIVLLTKLWWSETRGEATKSLGEWARILRESRRKTHKILKFFKQKHIADIAGLDNQTNNQNITIKSRRMVKDFEISQLRRRVGKLGGNPKLKKNETDLDNQKSNQKAPLPIPSPIPSPKDKEREREFAFELDVVELFNQTFPDHPHLKEPVTDTKTGLTTLKQIRMRRKERKWGEEVGPWVTFFSECAKSEFLTKKMRWFDLQWITRPTNMEKAERGNYKNDKPPKGKGFRRVAEDELSDAEREKFDKYS